MVSDAVAPPQLGGLPYGNGQSSTFQKIEANRRAIRKPKTTDGMTCSVSAKATSASNSFSENRTVNRTGRVVAAIEIYLWRTFSQSFISSIARSDNGGGVQHWGPGR